MRYAKTEIILKSVFQFEYVVTCRIYAPIPNYVLNGRIRR